MRALLMGCLLVAGCASGGGQVPHQPAPMPMATNLPPLSASAAAAAMDPGYSDRMPAASRVAADRWQRQDDYCRDIANDIATSSASTSEILSDMLTGYSPRERRLHASCMASFRRIDRFMAP